MKTAYRVGMLDRQAHQVATGRLPCRNKQAFAFNRDRMRNQHAASPKPRLCQFNHGR